MNKMNAPTIKSHASGRCCEIIIALASHLAPMIERGNRHGPCGLCGGTDRARLHNDFAETGGIFCNQCGGGADIFAVLMWANGWSFPETIDAVAGFLGFGEGCCPAIRQKVKPAPTKDWSQERRLLKAIWCETIPDPGRIAEYLYFRGLGGEIPKGLKFHPSLYYSHGREKGFFPAMVAQFVRGREAVGLHRTWLDKNGSGKAPVSKPKKTIKCADSMSGGAIQIFKHDPGKPLVLCEGIETGLAVHEHSVWPVWACGNAILLEKVIVPEEVKEVYIAVDKDRTRTGEIKSANLAKRLKSEGKKVSLSIPPGEIPEGKSSLDWLDVLSQEVIYG